MTTTKRRTDGATNTAGPDKTDGPLRPSSAVQVSPTAEPPRVIFSTDGDWGPGLEDAVTTSTAITEGRRLAWDWLRDVRDHPTLTAKARLAAAVLYTYMDPDGTNCWPSMGTIGRGMGPAGINPEKGDGTLRTDRELDRIYAQRASRALTELEGAGVLRVERHSRGGHWAARYTPLSLPRPRPDTVPEGSSPPSRYRVGTVPGGVLGTVPERLGTAPVKPRYRASTVRPSHYRPIKTDPQVVGSILNEEEEKPRNFTGPSPEAVAAATRAYDKNIDEGKTIAHRDAWIRATARNMEAEGQVPGPADPDTYTDAALERALRATRSTGTDNALIDEGLRRGWSDEKVADLTGIDSPEYLAVRRRRARTA